MLPGTDTDRRESEENPDPRVRQPEHLFAEQHHHELQQRRRETGSTPTAPPRRAKARKCGGSPLQAEPNLLPQDSSQSPRSEWQASRARMPKLQAVPVTRNRGASDGPDQPHAVLPDVEHLQLPMAVPADDGDEGAHLQQAVDARQIAIGQHFRSADANSQGLKNVECVAIRKSTT